MRDAPATTGTRVAIDAGDGSGADLCVTVTVDPATNLPTVTIRKLTNAPAVDPVLVQAQITVGTTPYVIGYDARSDTAPVNFVGTTTGLKTSFSTSTPGASLHVIGQSGSNEASGTYMPVPANGTINFGFDASGISLGQTASAPIAAFTGTFSLAGIFTVSMPATNMPATSNVHIGLDPVDVTIASSGTIGHVGLDMTLPQGIVGRATQGHISLDQVPPNVEVSVAPGMSGVTFDAHGATVGGIEAQFSDGSTDALPVGTDGILYEDLADRYVIFGRITGLQRIAVAVQGTQITADVNITGNQVFDAVIKTQAAATDPVSTTSATFDHIVPAMHLFVDTAGGKINAQYSASAATNSLTVTSNAFGANALDLSLAPVPQNLSVCFAGTNACVPSLDPSVTSVSLRASQQTTLNASLGAVKAENVQVTWLDAGFVIDPSPAGRAYFDTDGMPLSGHITDGSSIDIVAPQGFSSRARSIHFWLTYFLFIPIVHMERSGSVTCPAGTSVRISAMGQMLDATYGIYFGPFRLANGICDGSSGANPALFSQIRNPDLNRCLDDTGSNTGNGTWAQSYPCTGNPNQGWMQRPDGSFILLTNPSKCLDGNKNAAVGDHVLIWDCNGGANQTWTVVGNQIRNNVNNLCLTITGGSAQPTTPMTLAACDNSVGQHFNLEAQQAGTYSELYNSGMAQCAALSGGSTSNGTGIVSWGCDGSPGQGFSMDASGNVVSAAGPGSCLDGQTGTLGSRVILWPCHGTPNQKWTLNGTALQNSVNGLCLAIQGGATVPGTAFVLATCDGSVSQRFNFQTLQAQAFGQMINPGLNECIGVQGGSMSNGARADVYPCDGSAPQGWTGTLAGTINNSANQGKCLDATTGNVGDAVVIWDCHGSANQNWTVSGGQIQNSINGLCLAVPGNSAVPQTALVLQTCNGSPEQTFSVQTQQAASNQQIYSGALDRCIDIRNGSTSNGSVAQAFPCTGQTNQGFQLGVGNQVLLAKSLTKCLDGTGGGVGASVVLWDCHGSTNQQWKVSGTALVNQVNGLCLDVSAPATNPGAGLVLATCTGSPNQQWTTQNPRPQTNQIIRNVAEHTCLGLAGGSTADGASTGSWTCSGQADSLWHLDPSGQMISSAALSKCLDSNNLAVVGASVRLYPCNQSPYQRWTFQNGQLVNATHNLCLTSMNGSTMIGSVYTLQTCTGSTAQIFELDTTVTQAPYSVQNPTVARCLEPLGDAGSNTTPIVSMPCTGSTAQHFDLTADGHLVSGVTGARCVDASRTAPVGLALLYDCSAVAWQQWIPVNGQLVNKVDNTCLTLRENSSIAGTSLSTATCDGSDSQRFNLGP
ncbi:MAG: ricin-type beta-trefoil lectin domain protein [Actinobacteria bacterium]|nr:ricin-type beta-trefoil lectin domain protein [Actinomycetota bacterium]